GEGGRAPAAIATVTSLSIAFGTAVAGVLVNLGGTSMLDSARYTLFGFAIICALGSVTAARGDTLKEVRAVRGEPA
ncbi:MFS transporter, partial [Nonomuraea guangzhouensis]